MASTQLISSMRLLFVFAFFLFIPIVVSAQSDVSEMTSDEMWDIYWEKSKQERELRANMPTYAELHLGSDDLDGIYGGDTWISKIFLGVGIKQEDFGKRKDAEQLIKEKGLLWLFTGNLFRSHNESSSELYEGFLDSGLQPEEAYSKANTVLLDKDYRSTLSSDEALVLKNWTEDNRASAFGHFVFSGIAFWILISLAKSLLRKIKNLFNSDVPKPPAINSISSNETGVFHSKNREKTVEVDERISASTSVVQNLGESIEINITLDDFSKNNFNPRIVDWEKVSKSRKNTGELGEQYVLFYEKELLKQQGKTKLVDKVVLAGHGAGYDVRSCSEFGGDKYIEVKSSEYENIKSFTITTNELDFLRSNLDASYIYIVTDVKNNPTLQKISARDFLKRATFTPNEFSLTL